MPQLYSLWECHYRQIAISSPDRQTHKIEAHKLYCNSEKLIYCIKCSCGLVYVGKTEGKIKIRVTEHKSMIRTHSCNSHVVTLARLQT